MTLASKDASGITEFKPKNLFQIWIEWSQRYFIIFKQMMCYMYVKNREEQQSNSKAIIYITISSSAGQNRTDRDFLYEKRLNPLI